MTPPTATPFSASQPQPRLRKPWEVLDEEILPELSMDLVFGELRRLQADGKNFKSCCPIHGGDQSDAFFVNPKRLEWICFLGCGVGGPVQFLQKTQRLNWVEAAQALAVMAGVDPARLQIWGQHWTEEDFERHERLEHRAALLHIFMTLARNSLLSAAGKSLRGFLKSRHGMDEEGIARAGLGLYTAPSEVFPFLKRTGQDLTELRERGFFEADWSGRIVAPWPDLDGRTVNLWSWNPSTKLLSDESADFGSVLFERDLLGSQKTPFQLYTALEQGITDLVLLDDILEGVLCASMGLCDPFPVAVNGKLVADQVEAFERALSETGSLTLLSSYNPETHGRPDDVTAKNRKALDGVAFPVFVVDSALLAGDPKDPARPSALIKRSGLEKFGGIVKQSEVVLGSASPVADKTESWSGWGKVFKGLTKRGPGGEAYETGPFDEQPDASRAGGFPPTLIGALMQAAEEFGHRIAKGFLKALPSGLATSLQSDQAQLPAAEQKQLTGHVDAESPPPFSVDRLEERGLAIGAAKPAGLLQLDELGVRFRPGELALLAGRGAHGRTSTIVGLLVYWLYKTEESFIFLSYDESEMQIYHRLLSHLTAVTGQGLSVNVIRNHFGQSLDGSQSSLDAEQTETLENARECLRGWEDRLQVIYRPNWSALEIDRHVRELSKDKLIGAILIDPLEKIAPKAAAAGEDNTARWLKSIAVDLSCPVVATVRLEKLKPAKLKKKDRPDAEKKLSTEELLRDPAMIELIRKRRPRLSDLSDELEQEADLVLAVLSHATVFASMALGTPPETTTLEVGVLKNRSGPTGEWVELIFERPYCVVRDP